MSDVTKEHIALQELGEYVAYLKSPVRIIWANFLAGVARGLGFVIGATIVLAATVWVLVNLLGNLPWVGDFFLEAGSFVQSIQGAAQKIQGL